MVIELWCVNNINCTILPARFECIAGVYLRISLIWDKTLYITLVPCERNYGREYFPSKLQVLLTTGTNHSTTNHHPISPEFSRWQLDYKVKWKESYYSVFESTVPRNYSNLYQPTLLPFEHKRREFLLHILVQRSYFWRTFIRFIVYWLGYSGINWPRSSWETHIIPDTPGNRHYSWNLKIYFRVYKSPPLVCILS
jgi:hypothetical protein